MRHLEHDDKLSVRVAFNNARGLPEIFNQYIDQADDEAILVFVHDDVWLDEVNLVDAVIAGLTRFDVIGVAGNRRRVANQPAWAFTDDRLTWDVKSNLSGRVAHGKDAFGEISNFGTVPAECELLDGVFLATKKSSLKERSVRFDAQFDFHFYDMDFCRSAKKAGLKLGTWPINLTHQSGGAFGSQLWTELYQVYTHKWEEGVNAKARSGTAHTPHLKQQSSIVRNTSMATTKLTKALFNLAQDNENTGNQIAAACLYGEALKLAPENANINYRLGLIEMALKGAVEALPRFEAAIQFQPQHEAYWVAYIDALIQTGALETAASALECGQNYGLSASTAEKIAANCVAALEEKLKPTPAEAVSAYPADELAWPPAPVWPATNLSLTADLSYLQQPSSTGRRYVIYAPFYRHNSAGIRVMYDLQKWLILAGYDAIVIAAINGYTTEQFSEDIVIYPEVVTGNPLRAKRVVRYVLNVPGKLGGTKHYAPHELLVAYNDLLAEHADGRVLNVPTIESFFCKTDAPKTKSAVYVGKGKDLGLHPTECVYFTRDFPSTRRGVAALLKQVSTLYTYDNFTAIAAEALLCGCEVKVIQQDGEITDLPDSILNSVTSAAHDFKAQLHDFIEVTKLM